MIENAIRYQSHCYYLLARTIHTSNSTNSAYHYHSSKIFDSYHHQGYYYQRHELNTKGKFQLPKTGNRVIEIISESIQNHSQHDICKITADIKITNSKD